MELYMFKINKKEKKQEYQSPEYKHFIILRIVSITFVGLLLLGSGIGAFFIYKNIFNTIEQANSLLLINNPSTEIINFTRYENVKQSWEKKNNLELVNITTDPFNLFSNKEKVEVE